MLTVAEPTATEPSMGTWQKRVLVALYVAVCAVELFALVVMRSLWLGLFAPLPFLYPIVVVRNWHKPPKEP